MRLENNNKWRRGGRIQWKNGFFLCRRHQPSLQDPWRRPPLCPFSYSSCLVLNQLDRSSLPFCFPKVQINPFCLLFMTGSLTCLELLASQLLHRSHSIDLHAANKSSSKVLNLQEMYIDRDSPLTPNRVSEILLTCANTLAVGL
ncbi:hypothetical protein NC652_029202 [Populus alba x Populus x berolinensis]|nr:hypothetical protein NC652_029202 [Populus alba x Populus x berolinensis]